VLLLGHAAWQWQHVYFVDERDRLRVSHCEREKRRSGFLVRRQRALKDRWLIDNMAPAEVVDRHDQPRTAVTLEKLELALSGPSATMPPFGMCPEPAPITSGDLF
jgi:hypothetical protein